MRIRYSRWDGSQSVPDLDADEILSAISDDLLADGDLWSALRRMYANMKARQPASGAAGTARQNKGRRGPPLAAE